MGNAKINAAKAAIEHVKDGMCVGLGSGTTVKEFIKLLGEKVRNDGLKITCVTTSFDSRMLAIENGLFVTETDAINEIDIAVDGADKVTRTALLKGGGGALTREKIIDYNAKKFIVIVDEGKVQETLKGPVNLEVLPFAAPLIMKKLGKYHPKIRMSTAKLGPVISDNGSFIIDCEMEVKNPEEMEQQLKSMPGIIENGIFTKFDIIIVGNEKGHRVL
ncbi:ribose 5-phosphate isomerase A [Candidatus Micrarchaeota archaeon]|nr:ribose 5-phosphate isomerase A [Candidatus Micrarchaeota archaeon]MBU1166454.1 ribose 5-phosphate isomerase A [Candidatus Micrarchaeota archaeon]MBU1886539.1 ribose 5-phosphate isomerase A [Candidatus Micrarchaeota archaeon]